MKTIQRYLQPILEKTLYTTKMSVLLYGPRQVGKTTLAKNFVGEDDLYINCDASEIVRELIPNTEKLKQVAGKYSTIVIDEAQRLENAGIVCKLLIDTFPEKRFIITGSSALELSYGTFDALTGRVFTYALWGIATIELLATRNIIEMKELLNTQLVYGSYPAIYNLQNDNERYTYIKNIHEHALFKDTLSFEMQKSPSFIKKLVALLASRTGSQISINSLANTLDVGRETVERYLRLLEQLFIIVPLRPYHRNFTNKITKQSKYLFIDVGVRNASIDNFGLPETRDDIGGLWENFIIIERMKRNSSLGLSPNYYFYRGEKGYEVDLLEEHDGKITCFEIKYSGSKPSRGVYNAVKTELKIDTIEVINRDNFIQYIT